MRMPAMVQRTCPEPSIDAGNSNRDANSPRMTPANEPTIP